MRSRSTASLSTQRMQQLLFVMPSPRRCVHAARSIPIGANVGSLFSLNEDQQDRCRARVIDFRLSLRTSQNVACAGRCSVSRPCSFCSHWQQPPRIAKSSAQSNSSTEPTKNATFSHSKPAMALFRRMKGRRPPVFDFEIFPQTPLVR